MILTNKHSNDECMANTLELGDPVHQQDVSFHQLNGKQSKLSDYRGKWVLINYWASWCKPCYKEIPELNEFYQAHNAKVILLGVSFDLVKGAKLKQIVRKMKIQFPTLSKDPAQELAIGNVPGLPITYVFGPNGKLQNTLYGSQTRENLEQAIGIS